MEKKKLSWERPIRRYKLSKVDNSCKMSDSQLNLKSKTEMSVAKSQNYMGGEGGTPHRKNITREGGTPHILPEQGDKRGGHRT